jgi:polar amino acid transport system permease protein
MAAEEVPGVSPSAGTTRYADQRVVPVRHYGRGVLAAVVAVIVVLVVYGFASNPNIEWSVVGDFIFNVNILRGLRTTLEMTALSMVLSVLLAVVLALMRMSESRIISLTAGGYVFIFRGVPLILLLIFVGNLGLFVKHITIGIPFTGLNVLDRASSDVLTPFVASVVGLTLAGAAYMSEIVRGGLLAIGRGQHDAAKALGLNGLQTTRHVVLPQALRVIVPPMGNELISMLKATAIVSVIAGGDLLTVAQGISGSNYRTIELLIVAAIWYFVVIAVLTVGQYLLERRIAER